MDKYYGNVCELDIIFNFQKAYFILDELLLAGEMQESSKKNVLRCISQEDSLEDMEVGPRILLLPLRFLAPLLLLASFAALSPAIFCQTNCGIFIIRSLTIL
jgi:Clathrin adaptor complex small chain